MRVTVMELLWLPVTEGVPVPTPVGSVTVAETEWEPVTDGEVEKEKEALGLTLAEPESVAACRRRAPHGSPSAPAPPAPAPLAPPAASPWGATAGPTEGAGNNIKLPSVAGDGAGCTPAEALGSTCHAAERATEAAVSGRAAGGESAR